MKKNYKMKNIITFIFSNLLFYSILQAQPVTQTFSYTGSMQSFTVPPCVTSITVDLRGAQGANALDKLPTNSTGGLGGRALGVMTVTSGQVLNIYVGGVGSTTGTGGYNGGGQAGNSSAGGGCNGGYAGGGGGASDIRIGGMALSNRVVVAGGGGGAGRDYCNGSCVPCGCGGSGGGGGGLSGIIGQAANNCGYSYPGGGINGGAPGTSTAGGAGAPGDNGGNAGTSGTLGIGGTGGAGSYDVAGGGGGGGYYGGGGGGSASSGSGVGGGGGGGGSSFIANLTNAITTPSFQTGNGLVILSYNFLGNLVSATSSPTAICSGSSAILNASGSVTYTWFPVGGFGGSNSASVSVNPSTTTAFTVQGTNSLNCVSQAIITVTVNTTVPTLSVNNSSSGFICPGQSVVLNATGALTHIWSGGVTNGTSFTPSVSNTYTVTGTNGCGTATAVTSVSVNPSPTITIAASASSVCLGNSATLTASGASTYVWNNSVQNGVSFSPTVTSNYTVIGTSAIGCTSQAVATLSVVPFSAPVVSISATSSSLCSGATTTLNATGVSTYTWIPVNQFAGSNSPSISQTPTVSTVYSVEATNASGCISKASLSVIVNTAVPTLSVVNTTSGFICPGKTATLTASGAFTYTWTGNVVNGVSFQPSVTAVYTVTGSNACGINTATTSISVNPQPTITIAASASSLCSGSTATLVASGATTYTWTNGVTNGVSFIPTNTATYIVTGTNSATGCTANAATAITVVTTPILAPVASPTLICIGNSATLTATGAANYSWSTSQTTSSIVVSPTVTTPYTITKWNANCFDTKTVTVVVNQLPTIFAIGSTTVCAMQCTTLNAGGGSSYSWFPFGGNSSQAVVCPANSTTFVVTASDGTCVNTASVPVSVNPLPTINIAPSSTVICEGQTVTLTLSGTDTYSWTNPSSLGTATYVTQNPSGPILYGVTGTNTLTGCSNSASQIVLVNAVPLMTVTPTKSLVCVGFPSTLTVKGNQSNYSYLWSTGGTGTNTIVNPTVTTVYNVTATNTLTSCNSTSLVTVNVFQPTFAVNSPTSSCLGGTITLIATGANSYTWNGNSPFQTIQVSPSTATFYVVAATSTLSGVSCISTNTVNVSIYANPTITAAPSRTIICKGEQVALNAFGGTTYTWSNQQSGSTVSVTLQSQTNFTVNGTDQNGCKGTATLQVKVSPCPGISENQAGKPEITIYPNPSSGDFIIESESDIQLTLVNELGQLIMDVTLDGSNDHKASVTNLTKGIYFISNKNALEPIRQKIIIQK
jgi:hypothetical protein